MAKHIFPWHLLAVLYKTETPENLVFTRDSGVFAFLMIVEVMGLEPIK